MLRFGKYKGKTYEHVYRTDKGYCAWFVENCKQGKDFKSFILEKGLFNKATLVGKHTTASALAKKIMMDPEIRLFVAELWEKELAAHDDQDPSEEDPQDQDPQDQDGGDDNDSTPVPLDSPRGTTHRRAIANPKKNITPQLYGQFIDYFIRYRLSQAMDVTFKDRAIATIIKKKLPGWEIVFKAMEMLNDPGCSILEGDSKAISPLVFHNLLRCASAHSLAFDGRKTKAQRVMLELDDEIVKRVDTFVSGIVTGGMGGSTTAGAGSPAKPVVFQNPNISGSHISADADLIFGSTIVDFKTGRDDFVYYTVQLLIYAVLYRDLYDPVEVKNLLIFNPCMEDHSVNLTLQDGVLDRFSAYLKKLKLL